MPVTDESDTADSPDVIDEYEHPRLPPRERCLRKTGFGLAVTAAVFAVANLVLALTSNTPSPHAWQRFLGIATINIAVACAILAGAERLTRYNRELDRQLLRDVRSMKCKLDGRLAAEFLAGSQATLDRVNGNGKVTAILR